MEVKTEIILDSEKGNYHNTLLFASFCVFFFKTVQEVADTDIVQERIQVHKFGKGGSLFQCLCAHM